MDWKVMATTFIAVFLAELGDKTQMAVLAEASSTSRFWEVFIGASVALVLSTLLAAILGSYMGTRFPQRFIRVAAGLVFIALGAFMLLKKAP